MFVATYDSSSISMVCAVTPVCLYISMVQVSEGKSFQEEVVEQLPEDLRVRHSAVPDSAMLYVRTYKSGDIVFNSFQACIGDRLCVYYLAMQCPLF